MALEAPDDHSLDPRAAVHALRVACERAGVEIEEHAEDPAPVLGSATGRAEGVRVADEVRRADQVVLATGAWSGRLGGIADDARVPVRPVKGQTIRLRDPAGPGLLHRAIRCERAYIVPRDDGRYVLGATVEERGFELEATAGASYELLRAAHELVPGTSELHLEEVCVGLRPGTPDNVPFIGRAAFEGLLWATGHYRNGILLTPLTADLVVGLLTGEHAAHDDELLRTCDPGRFAGAAAADAAAARRATVPA
jgi:glycine oxidase